MRKIKALYLTIWHWLRQVCLHPQTLADAARKKQRRSVVSEDEAERLDRLRNPSKYMGK
jgi:hypothetical protein